MEKCGKFFSVLFLYFTFGPTFVCGRIRLQECNIMNPKIESSPESDLLVQDKYVAV
jgi:hypothetical protein